MVQELLSGVHGIYHNLIITLCCSTDTGVAKTNNYRLSKTNTYTAQSMVLNTHTAHSPKHTHTAYTQRIVLNTHIQHTVLNTHIQLIQSTVLNTHIKHSPK